MTEKHRQNLLTACAFAKVFLASADAELRGASYYPREEAANQLTAALLHLEEFHD